MQAHDQPALGWTVVLRRQPVRIVEGQPEGGYTDAYELICCECGDHPHLDYREISAELRRIRGPYAFAIGIAAYGEHVRLRHRRLGRRILRCGSGILQERRARRQLRCRQSQNRDDC